MFGTLDDTVSVLAQAKVPLEKEWQDKPSHALGLERLSKEISTEKDNVWILACKGRWARTTADCRVCSHRYGFHGILQESSRGWCGSGRVQLSVQVRFFVTQAVGPRGRAGGTSDHFHPPETNGRDIITWVTLYAHIGLVTNNAINCYFQRQVKFRAHQRMPCSSSRGSLTRF